MKSIILGAITAIVSVAALVAPAGATGNLSAGSSSGISGGGYSHIAIKDGKMTFEMEYTMCSAFVMGANFNTSGAAPVAAGKTEIADPQGCDANQVVNNPPANSTVTISGLCDADAAAARTHVTGANVTVIVNSTGPCEDGDNNNGPTTPVVIVTPNAPTPTGPVVTTASASNETPAGSNYSKGGNGAVDYLPQTGVSGAVMTAIAAGLATISYAGTMAIRSLRTRG